MDKVQPSDRELLHRGDTRAWEMLWDRWSDRLFGYLVTMLVSRDAAEDALQETFLRLAENRLILADAREPLAYAFHITATAARRLGRRGGQTQTWSEEKEECLLVSKQEDALDLDADLLEALSEALFALHPDQREVVVLRVWEDRSFAEIAQILDLSPNTVASRWRYALQHLKASLHRRVYD